MSKDLGNVKILSNNAEITLDNAKKNIMPLGKTIGRAKFILSKIHVNGQ